MVESEKIIAKISSPYGEVKLEGSAKAIKQIIKGLPNREPITHKKKNKEKTIGELIVELIEEGFFNVPKTLGEITNKIKLKGFTKYPTTSVYPVLLRQFIKEGIILREGKKGTMKYFTSKLE